MQDEESQKNVLIKWIDNNFFFTDIYKYPFKIQLYWYQIIFSMYKNSKIRFITLLAFVLISSFAIDQLPYGDTQIQGNYVATLSSQNDSPQPISINIGSGTVRIQGCNQLQSPYTYDISTRILSCGEFSSTKKACDNDQDSLVVNAFKNALKAYLKSGSLVLEDRKGSQLIKFQIGLIAVTTTSVTQGAPVIKSTQVTTKKIVTTQVVTTTTTTEVSSTKTVSKQTTLFIVGRYQFTLPALQLTINQNSYSLRGCNNHNFEAQFSTGGVRFSDPLSTRKACRIDFDRYYLQAFSLGRNLIKISTGYRLLDENSKLLLQFILQSSGSYLCSVPSVVISVEPNAFAFQGCNIHSIDYKLLGDSGIQFGQDVSTKRSCLFFDYDEYILSSIKLANSYQILEKTFVLKNGDTITGIALTKVQVPQINILPSITEIASSPASAPVSPPSGTSPIIYQLPPPPPQSQPQPQPQYQPTPTSVLNQNPPIYIPAPAPTPVSISNPVSSQEQYSPTYSPLIVIATSVIAPQPITTAVPIITQVPQIPIPVVIPTSLCTPVVITDYQAIVPPTVALPGVAATSLRGTYRIQFLGSDISPVILVFDDEYVQFEGCNINRLPYAAYTDGLFVILTGGSSTKRQCAVNRDSEIIRALKYINRFSKSELGYVLYQNERAVANINYKIRNQVVTYNVINGGYQVDIPGIDAIVADSQISFRGCNSVSISYQLGQNGAIKIGQAIATSMFCELDSDSVYTNAISTGVQLKQIPEGFVLVDIKGVERVRFISLYRSSNYGFDSFTGKFRLQLPSSGIRLKITDGTFTLTGCNQFNFKFSLADNGNIIFNKVSSTKTLCSVDFDRAFLNAILKAQRIAVFDNIIIFTSGTNQQVAKIINPDIVPNRQTVVLIDPKSPVVRKTDYKLVQGTYTVALLKSSLKKLSLTVQGKTITIKGCNSHRYSYNAISDGTIQFQYVSSTEKSCAEDLDQYYLQAINNIRKFYASKGMYTFYDSNGKSLMTFLASSGIANLITETGSPVPVPVPISPQILIPVSPPIQVPITDPMPPLGYIPGSSNPSRNPGNPNIPITDPMPPPGYIPGSSNPSNTNLGIPFLPVSEPIIPVITSNPFDNNYGTTPVTGPTTSSTPHVPYVPPQPETPTQPQSIPVTPYIPYIPVAQPVVQPVIDPIVQPYVQPSTPTLPLTSNIPVLVDSSSHGSSESGTNSNQQDTKQWVEQSKIQGSENEKDKTSLDGKYQFELPEFGVEINKNSFIFKGCNTHRFPCSFRRDKIFFGDPISTNKKCENDNDKFFLDLLPKVTTFKKENKKCRFFNSRLQSLFEAQFTETDDKESVKASTPVPLPIPTSIPQPVSAPASPLVGSCMVKIPRIQIQISNSNINFRGCPRDRFSYKAYNAGNIFFKKGRNPKSCAFQYDDVFKNTIKGCSKFRKNNVGFTFEDYEGIERGRCFRSSW